MTLLGQQTGDLLTCYESATLLHAEMGWNLLWADEFDKSALDSSSWTAQSGDGSAEGIPGRLSYAS